MLNRLWQRFLFWLVGPVHNHDEGDWRADCPAHNHTTCLTDGCKCPPTHDGDHIGYCCDCYDSNVTGDTIADTCCSSCH